MLRRECCESGKNLLYGTRLNPKYFIMGNQPLSSEQEKDQRLSRGHRNVTLGVRLKLLEWVKIP